MALLQDSYLCGWYSPHFVVIRPHEEIGNTGTHHSDDPLIKVLGLCRGNSSLEGGIDHSIHTFDLFFFWQHGNIVLEWIWNPEFLASNIGDTLVRVPIVFLREGLIDAVIKIFVVGKNDMPANVVELSSLAIGNINW